MARGALSDKEMADLFEVAVTQNLESLELEHMLKIVGNIRREFNSDGLTGKAKSDHFMRMSSLNQTI